MRLKRSIVILVDAGRAPSGDWVQKVEGPSGMELVKAASDTAVQASVRSSYTAFERMMADWQRQVIAWRCGLSPELRKRYRRAGQLELPRHQDSWSPAWPSINSVRSAPRCSTRSTRGSSCRSIRSMR